MGRIFLFDKNDIDGFPKFDPDGDDKRLFDAIGNDELVVFYGAGVSRLGGCSSWPELARNIINEFPSEIYSEIDKVVLRDFAGNDPKKAISICYHASEKHEELLKNVYFKALRDSVTPKSIEDQENFAAIHKQIFSLNAVAYITTNIDKGIETISSVDLGSKEIIDLTADLTFDPTDRIKNGNIFYLHGTIDNPEKTIFTVDNYLKFYSSADSRTVGRDINTFLRKVFGGEYTVLFIGYGLSEYEILQNIFLATKDRDKALENKHFLLAPIYSKDLARFNIEKEYFQIFSVQAIPYFIDFEGFDRLYYVLEQLRTIVEERKPAAISIYKEIDEV